MPTPIAHLILPLHEVADLSLSAARAIRDQWVEPLQRDLVWDVTIPGTEEETDELVEAIADQGDRAASAYAWLRRELRAVDAGSHDWMALRLEVFESLCRHVARLEREGIREAFLAAA